MPRPEPASYTPRDKDYRVSPGGSSVTMFYNGAWGAFFSDTPEAVQRWLDQHGYLRVHRGDEYTYWRKQ